LKEIKDCTEKKYPSSGQGWDYCFEGKDKVGSALVYSDKVIHKPNYQTARKYWNKLKERLKREGSELVTNCHQLKLAAADGKKYLTDAADPETLLRLIQSVPSPKAEPIKLWLAKTGYERMQDMADPARSLDRTKGLLAPARQKQKMDSAKNDGAGNPQQAHRLLERSCKTGDGSLFENPLLSLAK